MPSYSGTATSIASSLNGSAGMTLFSGWQNIDDGYLAVTLPFNINFLGTTQSVVYVGSNGYLTFGAGSSSVSVPSGIDRIILLPGDRRMIAMYEDTQGSAPNRKYILRMELSSYYTSYTANCFCEVTFYENDTGDPNRIDVQYGDNAGAGSSTGLYATDNTEVIAPWSNASNTGWKLEHSAAIVYNWFNSYSSTPLANNALRGRTGMTVVYDNQYMPDPGNSYYTINLPFSISIFRNRSFSSLVASVGLFPASLVLYDQADATGDINMMTTMYWKAPGDGAEYTDERTTSEAGVGGATTTKAWVGYIVEGTAPNRTFTYREEFTQTQKSFAPYDYVPNRRTIELKFYEDKRAVDVFTTSDLAEEIQIVLKYNDYITNTVTPIPYDDPFVPDPLIPYVYPIYGWGRVATAETNATYAAHRLVTADAWQLATDPLPADPPATSPLPGNWFNTYIATEITKSLRGRTGMTVYYDADTAGGPPADFYDFKLPRYFNLFRYRDFNTVRIWATGSEVLYFLDNTYDNYQGVGISWQLPTDGTNEYTDYRTLTTKWAGAILEGTYPNRVLTIRLEFDTTVQIDPFTTVVPNKVLEYKIYESLDYVEAHLNAETEEPASFDFSWSDSDGMFTNSGGLQPSAYFDFPRLADPLSADGYYSPIIRTLGSTDNKAYRLRMTDEWGLTPSPPPPPGPPPPPPPPPPPAGVKPPEYFGRILNYDQVWKGNTNVELAITTADVGYHNVSANSITIINIQNASNTYNAFVPFYLQENVYTSDAGITFKFLDREFYVYLDTALSGNGYGFAPGSTITQTCGRKTIDVVLTEDEYLSICGCASCGCKVDECGCVDGPSTVADRTIPVVVAEAKTVTATVVRENIEPPYLVVANTDGIFCDNVITSGSITANIVGALAPPLKRPAYLGPYLIEKVAKYKDEYYDGCGNFVGNNNLGDYFGPHIGIDRHFTNRRSMDHDDMFIVMANWNDTNRNVPMGRILDYWHNTDIDYTSIGMAVNVRPNVASTNTARLLDINYNNIVYSGDDFNIHVKDNGQLRMNVSSNTYHHFKIYDRCGDVVFFGETADFNTTMYTRSYAEKTLPTFSFFGTEYVDPNFANMYETTTIGGEFDNITVRPKMDMGRANSAYSSTVVINGDPNFGPDYYWDTSVAWGGYVPSGWYSTAEQVTIQFMAIGEANTSWYGFSNYPPDTRLNPYISWPWSVGPNDPYIPYILVNFNWYYSPFYYYYLPLDGIDLNTRVWIEIPDFEDNFTGNIVGPGFTDFIYIGNNVFGYNSTRYQGAYEEFFQIPLGDIIQAVPLEYLSSNHAGTQKNIIHNIDYNATRIASSITGNSTMTYVGNYTGTNTQVQLSLPFTVSYGGSNTSSVYIKSDEAWVYFVTPTSYTGGLPGYGKNVIKPLYNADKYLNDLYYLNGGSYYIIRAECGNYNSATDTIYELTIFNSGLDKSARYEVQYETVTPNLYMPYPQGTTANGDIANSITVSTSTVYWGANTSEGWRMMDSGNRTVQTVPSNLGPYIDVHLGAYWEDPGTGAVTHRFTCNVASSASGSPYSPYTITKMLELGSREAPVLAANASPGDTTTNNGPNYFATVRCYLNFLNLVEITP